MVEIELDNLTDGLTRGTKVKRRCWVDGISSFGINLGKLLEGNGSVNLDLRRAVECFETCLNVNEQRGWKLNRESVRVRDIKTK